MARKVKQLCEKDHTLISCRRVIRRMLEANPQFPFPFAKYANQVADEAYAVMDVDAKLVADEER